MHRSTLYRRLLAQSLEDLSALSAKRSRLGETNVKGHMFLKMILAQAEAGEAGLSAESTELAIAQTARDSLLFCRGLLQTLAEEAAVPLVSPPATTMTSMDDELEAFGGLDWNFNFFLEEEGMSL